MADVKKIYIGDDQGKAVDLTKAFGGGVGKDLSGQTVKPTSSTTVTAGEGAEIFNDYEDRTYSNSAPMTGNVASGAYSHAEGTRTTASGIASHAEGGVTTASGDYSHAEGSFYSKATGNNSHAEGDHTTASGSSSHAEGSSATASGAYSHAEGNSTTASAMASHAEGYGTTAGYTCQHVSGIYNNNKSDTLLEIGNGTSSDTSNAFEVTSDGYIRTHNNSTKIAFGVDSNGNYGYIKDGADTVIPFKTGSEGVQGNAVAANVLVNDGTNNITFSSAAAGSNVAGTMTNNGAVSQTLNPGGSYTVPQGYHNGSGTISARSLILQEKSVTPSTTAQNVTPDSGKDGLSKVSVSAIATQTKSVTPSTTAQTITPDSGKYLTSVSVGAISAQTKTASLTGSQHSVTPDSGKYLTSVTIPAVVGTAGTGSVLSSATFSSASYPTGATGTIATRSASSETISAAKTYSAGYYPSSWTVTPNTGLISEIIAEGTFTIPSNYSDATLISSTIEGGTSIFRKFAESSSRMMHILFYILVIDPYGADSATDAQKTVYKPLIYQDYTLLKTPSNDSFTEFGNTLVMDSATFSRYNTIGQYIYTDASYIGESYTGYNTMSMFSIQFTSKTSSVYCECTSCIGQDYFYPFNDDTTPRFTINSLVLKGSYVSFLKDALPLGGTSAMYKIITYVT